MSIARKLTITEIEESPGRALQAARQGETVEVTSRGEVVALIGPPRPTGVRWGKPGKPVGLEEPIEAAGGIQDIVQDGRR